VRAVTFNIHHGTVAKKGPVRAERLGAVCAEFDADVLVLEEVDVATLRSRGVDLARAVADATGMAHAFGPARRFLGGWYGNAVFVRGDLTRWDAVALPRVPWWRVTQERRTYLAAQVTVAGLDLRVFGTHLAVEQDINGPQLAALLRHATASDGPVLVLGDLNRPTRKVQPEGAAVGLQLAPHGGTIPVHDPRNPIDHVLHSDHFTVRHVEVRPTEMSDHCALLVDFDVVTPAGDGG
jgi:endonuclease/exonuclease/phosphatase family metal-dependent hydrolase